MESDPKQPKQQFDKMPASPISPLGQGAIGLYEWFCSLMEAGFSERQASRLIADVLTAQPPQS